MRHDFYSQPFNYQELGRKQPSLNLNKYLLRGQAPEILLAPAPPVKNDGSFELSLYESVGLRDGRSANNPWLQELPDTPLKIIWDNYAHMTPAAAKKPSIKMSTPSILLT